IEADAETAFKTQEFWLSQQPNHKVQWHVGEALTVLPTLNLNPDFIFVDADKHNYKSYLNYCYPRLNKGGVMLFDNTLWSKRVINAHDLVTDRDTQNMHAFNLYAKQIENAMVTLIPIRDGITLITKLV
ncbi:MAG: O-methyltransferase, partial [Bacteroidota bacterium]